MYTYMSICAITLMIRARPTGANWWFGILSVIGRYSTLIYMPHAVRVRDNVHVI